MLHTTDIFCSGDGWCTETAGRLITFVAMLHVVVLSLAAHRFHSSFLMPLQFPPKLINNESDCWMRASAGQRVYVCLLVRLPGLNAVRRH